jgi:hypothetical protein
MVSGAARYDGHSEWYEELFSAGHPPAEELAFLRQALGHGGGQVCIDLACGTGLCAQPIAQAGGGSGLGGRVGFHHKTLASFLGAIAGSGLIIRDVREFSGGGLVLPRNIGLVAGK